MADRATTKKAAAAVVLFLVFFFFSGKHVFHGIAVRMALKGTGEKAIYILSYVSSF